MTVYVDQSPVGVGKTYNALSHIVNYPARYVFVTERQSSVLEIEERLRAMAFDRHIGFTIKTITSSHENRGSSVTTSITALPELFANDEAHVCVIITHAAMMMSDLSQFTGWNIVIDEVPAVVYQQSISSRTDVEFFERNYTLEPLTAEWSRVGLTVHGELLSSSELTDCDSHEHLRALHQRLKSGLRPVVCNLTAWEEMAQPAVQWTWWSIFDVRQLEAFENIKFLGSGFMSKLAAKMLKNYDPDVEWVCSSTLGHRQLHSKTVRIHYFTERSSSRYYFESEHGQRHLTQVARYLGSTMPQRSIWTANNPQSRPVTAYRTMKSQMGALRYVSPKQAGTSEFMTDYHDAAIIYASKPSKASQAIMEVLECTDADWVETNEFETILQFLTRTSVRDVTTGGHTNFYVMSKDQADYLKDFFDAQPHISATLEYVELGLEYPEPLKRGRKPVVLTPQEAAERAESNRLAKAERERQRRARLKAVL